MTIEERQTKSRKRQLTKLCGPYQNKFHGPAIKGLNNGVIYQTNVI